MGIQLYTGQEIAGIPALKVRDLLRGINDSSIAEEWLHERGYTPSQASDLLKALLSYKYVELDTDRRYDSRSFYKLTEEGRTVMRATGASRVKRKTAQRVLDDFMDRVRIMNESSDFLVRVTEVVVFGSYLSKSDTLGDIDIACAYESKLAHLDQAASHKLTREHFKKSGRVSKGPLSAIFWPWEEVLLFLKSKKRTISLHRIDEVMHMIEASPDFSFEVLLGDRDKITTRCGQSGAG